MKRKVYFLSYWLTKKKNSKKENVKDNFINLF